MTGVLVRRPHKHRETKGRQPREHRHREDDHVSTDGHMKTEAESGAVQVQAMEHQITAAIRSWKKQGRTCPYSLWREHGPADTPVFYFQHPLLWQNKFLLFSGTQSVFFCYGSPRKLTQLHENIIYPDYWGFWCPFTFYTQLKCLLLLTLVRPLSSYLSMNYNLMGNTQKKIIHWHLLICLI